MSKAAAGVFVSQIIYFSVIPSEQSREGSAGAALTSCLEHPGFCRDRENKPQIKKKISAQFPVWLGRNSCCSRDEAPSVPRHKRTTHGMGFVSFQCSKFNFPEGLVTAVRLSATFPGNWHNSVPDSPTFIWSSSLGMGPEWDRHPKQDGKFTLSAIFPG